jgi:hypothetical protein
MNPNPNEGKPAQRAPMKVRAEEARQWADVLLRWGWFVFEVVKWVSG